MKNYEDSDNEKLNRRKQFQSKKINKKFIDEDQLLQKKISKDFKQKKKQTVDEDEDWRNWNFYDFKD